MRPMGFDSFGLNAENAAIREGGHPRAVTERNIATIRRQMQRLGWAIDWEREVAAHQQGLDVAGRTFSRPGFRREAAFSGTDCGIR